jgi:hypothetical protein
MFEDFCFTHGRKWGMKSTNKHDLFPYMYACVDVVEHFVMNLVTMIHHKKCTNL